MRKSGNPSTALKLTLSTRSQISRVLLHRRGRTEVKERKFRFSPGWFLPCGSCCFRAKPRKRRKSNWDPFRDPFSTLDVEYHPTRSGGELLEEPSTASKKHKQMKKAKTEKAKRRSKVGFRTDGSAENPRAFIDYILPNRHGRANRYAVHHVTDASQTNSHLTEIFLTHMTKKV